MRQFKRLVINTETVKTMTQPFDGDQFPIGKVTDGILVIQRLTLFMKGTFSLFVFLPKVSMMIYLLWLGCRWLLATNNFQDLILNSVALEFILQLSSIIYMAMLPERNRHDLKKTKMLPSSPTESVGCHQFLIV